MISQKKAFITGITGFVGKYLTEYLQSQGTLVYGLDRWDTCSYPDVNYFQADILDSSALLKIFAQVQPDEVYHLAAISYLPEADASPRHALDINIMGTVSVLDICKQACPQTRVLLVGSSKEYDDNLDSDCVSESVHPEPKNFYGITKYAGELIGSQYVRQYGIDIRFTRSFNHTGPGQPPRFVCSDWAKQVAEIIAGKKEPIITVGSIDSEIDFTDVRDVVKAYSMVLSNGNKGEVYNVCSGKGATLLSILNYLTAKSSVKIEIKKIEAKLRAHKTNARMLGDNGKLRSIGWDCQIPLQKTLDDIFAYWRNQ